MQQACFSKSAALSLQLVCLVVYSWLRDLKKITFCSSDHQMITAQFDFDIATLHLSVQLLNFTPEIV